MRSRTKSINLHPKARPVPAQHDRFYHQQHDPFDEAQLCYQGYDNQATVEPNQRVALYDRQSTRPSEQRSATYTLPTPPNTNRQQTIYDDTPSKCPNGRQIYDLDKILLPSDSTGEMYLRSSDHQIPSPRALLDRNPVLIHENGQEIQAHKTSRFFDGVGANTTHKRPPVNTHGMPVLHGDTLVHVSELPDRIKPIFTHQLFNRMQSRCFEAAYSSNDNLVISAPTGSGKTVIFELAICRLATNSDITTSKIVYISPTKALCEERYADWSRRFGQIGITCNQLTGDSDSYQQNILRDSQLVITTPEKWDSITRKWHDQEKLMEMVKLMLIDEVHFLNDERGATIEAVVTRMKFKGRSVRFLALSATAPNSSDIAEWLGKNARDTSTPARLEVFGDEFRPTKLQRFVHSVPFASSLNDFAFCKHVQPKLPQIIEKYSVGKPILIFCISRALAEQTAELLATAWQNGSQNPWHCPCKTPSVQNLKLKQLVGTGVAFHHNGLESDDRKAVEKAYRDGELTVLCCTTTLAVGVNLPCHLVILYHTIKWSSDARYQDYSDLDITQMLGRAGRPEFGDQGVGVIITRPEKHEKYSRMIQGQQPLESQLQSNLIEHLNTEITLGTIHSLKEAKSWLASTFFYVRLKRNQGHYSTRKQSLDLSPDHQIEDICITNISALNKHKLIELQSYEDIRATGLGEIMTKYYLQFKTMVGFIDLPPRAKVRDILAMLCTAAEFHSFAMRKEEKILYSTFRGLTSTEHSPDRRTIVPNDAAKMTDNAEKISLIVRTILGGMDYPSDPKKPGLGSLKRQYNIEASNVLPKMLHLVRGFIECRHILRDGISMTSALMLSRSLSAKAWDDSVLVLRQLEDVGMETVSKMRSLGINNFDDLKNTPVEKLDRCRNISLFGTKLLANANRVPALRITGSLLRTTIVQNQIRVCCRVDIGFFNPAIPRTFQGQRIRLSLLILRSDGQLIDYKHIRDLGSPHDMSQKFSADLDEVDQSIICEIACEELAGTLQRAEIRPNIPAIEFLGRKKSTSTGTRVSVVTKPCGPPPKSSRDSEYGGDDLVADDFLAIEAAEFQSIDDFCSNTHLTGTNHPTKLLADKTVRNSAVLNGLQNESTTEHMKLGSENKECSHSCKDKSHCRHQCCKDGRKNPKRKRDLSTSNPVKSSKMSKPKETTARTLGQDPTDSDDPALLPKSGVAKTSIKQATSSLDRLHNSVKSQVVSSPTLTRAPITKPVQLLQPLVLGHDATSRIDSSKDWRLEAVVDHHDGRQDLAPVTGAVSPASSIATLLGDEIDQKTTRKRHRSMLDFLSEDELDGLLPQIDDCRDISDLSGKRQDSSFPIPPKKKLRHESFVQTTDNALGPISDQFSRESYSNRTPQHITEQVPTGITNIPFQPFTDHIEQMSQEIASYQPFKSVDEIDPAFMAQFEDYCEFIE